MAKTPLNTTDQELVDNLRNNGTNRRKSEDQLFATYHYFIREGIHKFNLSEDEAFDAYSDSILSAIENIRNGSFEGRASLKTWIYQIFHNKCVDLLRKKTTNKNSINQTASINDVTFQLSDPNKSVIQKLTDKEDWELLKLKLNELGDNCRQLLLLATDGYSDKEISQIMDYKTGDVVKTSRLRCLERLRQSYNASKKSS